MNAADARRRWTGVFCLAIASGMLIWGQTILKPYLDGLLYLGYWGLCFGFTLAAVVVALRDVQVLRQRTRQQQRDLVERTLDEVEQNSRDKNSESKGS